MKDREHTPDGIRIPLLLEVGLRCPMPTTSCGENFNKAQLQIHHINTRQRTVTHDSLRMIALCSSCHKRMHDGNHEEFLINLKPKHSIQPDENILDLNKINMLTYLNREGELQRLRNLLRPIMTHFMKYYNGSQIIPKLLEQRVRTLRKLGTEESKKHAKNLLKIYDKKLPSKLYPEKEFIILNARGALYFNDREFEPAYDNFNQLMERAGDFLKSRPYAKSQIEFRLNIINWYHNKNSVDIDVLDQYISLYKNIKLDKLLLDAVIKQKCVSKNWIEEVEKLYKEVESTDSLATLGYEQHTVAELFHMASIIYGSKSDYKKLGEKCKEKSKDFFDQGGSAKHSKVYEFHKRRK